LREQTEPVIQIIQADSQARSESACWVASDVAPAADREIYCPSIKDELCANETLPHLKRQVTNLSIAIAPMAPVSTAGAIAGKCTEANSIFRVSISSITGPFPRIWNVRHADAGPLPGPFANDMMIGADAGAAIT
jgi:hypothetical protein